MGWYLQMHAQHTGGSLFPWEEAIRNLEKLKVPIFKEWPTLEKTWYLRVHLHPHSGLILNHVQGCLCPAWASSPTNSSLFSPHHRWAHESCWYPSRTPPAPALCCRNWLYLWGDNAGREDELDQCSWHCKYCSVCEWYYSVWMPRRCLHSLYGSLTLPKHSQTVGQVPK